MALYIIMYFYFSSLILANTSLIFTVKMKFIEESTFDKINFNYDLMNVI